MRTCVTSRRGHFNWANPSEEKILTHISIYDGKEKIKHISIQTKYKISDDDPEELAYEIEQFLKTRLVTTQGKECEEMIAYLNTNARELRNGNDLYLLDRLEEEKQRIEKQISEVKARLER